MEIVKLLPKLQRDGSVKCLFIFLLHHFSKGLPMTIKPLHDTVQDNAGLTQDSAGQCRTLQDSAGQSRPYRTLQNNAGPCRRVQDNICRTGKCRTMQDLTEQCRTKQALQDTAEQCRTMQESAGQYAEKKQDSAGQYRPYTGQCRTM